MLTEPRPGLPLSQFVHLPCKIELNTIIIITTQLVHALVYLHSKSIVHKDIKVCDLCENMCFVKYMIVSLVMKTNSCMRNWSILICIYFFRIYMFIVCKKLQCTAELCFLMNNQSDFDWVLHKYLGISNIREDNFDVNMPY